MRASADGRHISGAERIVRPQDSPAVAARLAARALGHPKGRPDSINIKIEDAGDVLRIQALPVSTVRASSPQEGWAAACALLEKDGIGRAGEIREMFKDTAEMRGAMLLDADTLERLEPDRARGVRATRMDAAGCGAGISAGAKNHYAEAIVLASKVQHAPGIVAEICVSDDPDYTTGYIASKTLGYRRITCIKEKGDPRGGRIFLYRGPHSRVSETIAFLQEQSVLVENVPAPEPDVGKPGSRMDGIEEELASIRSGNLFRTCTAMEGPTGPHAVLGGRNVLVLSSNDYLDLARDPRVTAAAADAAARHGAGTGGSRLTTGTQPPHVSLESHLARFKGTEDAIVWATGYMANTGTISALARRGDVVLSDELNHASIIDGCRLSGAEIIVYRHNDMRDLEAKLSACRGFRRRLAVSDGIFSMDGDMLDLPAFTEICRRHDAFSIVDEAHSTGVAGDTGHGLREHFGCGNPDITIGTLSKALGSEGGFACCGKSMADYLRNKSRPFIFSTAPCASAAAAADAALSILENEPERVARLRANASFFAAELTRRGISAAEPAGAIIPVAAGGEKRALAAAAAALERGILVPAIRYPTVARGAARLRAAVMCSHTREELAGAAETLAEIFARLKP